MERHEVEEDQALAMLRDHARGTNTTVVDTARALVDGRLLLPSP
jgi:hypothetical protein